MRVNDLEGILKSPDGGILMCVVYDTWKGEVWESGCSAEYAVKEYGGCNLVGIAADGDKVVLKIS